MFLADLDKALAFVAGCIVAATVSLTLIAIWLCHHIHISIGWS